MPCKGQIRPLIGDLYYKYDMWYGEARSWSADKSAILVNKKPKAACQAKSQNPRLGKRTKREREQQFSSPLFFNTFLDVATANTIQERAIIPGLKLDCMESFKRLAVIKCFTIMLLFLGVL